MGALAYRSPAGRVRAYGKCGEVVETYEPGPAADSAWTRLKQNGADHHDGAGWMDPPAESGASEKGNEMSTETKKKVKRPRAGDWRKTTKDLPIPGSDGGILTVDFWHVEFDGEEFDVPATREGRRQATERINAIKAKKAETLEIARVRTQLVILRDKASTEEIRETLKRAAAAFGEE
jgi:hypothetical protein